MVSFAEKDGRHSIDDCRKMRFTTFRLAQALRHLALNVRQLLNANRQAYQPIGDTLSRSLGGIDVAVRGCGGMAACRRGVAERRAEGNAGRLAHEAIDRVPSAGEIETEHVAETAIEQAPGYLMIGMIGATRIEDARDGGLMR